MVTHLLWHTHCVSLNMQKNIEAEFNHFLSQHPKITEAHGIAQDAQESLVAAFDEGSNLLQKAAHGCITSEQNQATRIVCPIIRRRQGMLKCVFHV